MARRLRCGTGGGLIQMVTRVLPACPFIRGFNWQQAAFVSRHCHPVQRTTREADWQLN